MEAIVMRIDFGSLAFGYNVKIGGGTPNWATALGQGREHKINDDPAIDELLKGIIYSSVSLEKITTKIGKGGRMVAGNASDSPIVLGAVFPKVYINDVLIAGGKYILLVTKDTSEHHRGRLRIKYGPSNTYTEGGVVYSNDTFIRQMKQQLGMAEDACWFVSDISVVNQNELVLKTIIVNQNGSMEYENSADLHTSWEALEPTYLMANSAPTDDKEKNRIVFGAPGTGKSHRLDEDSECFGKHVERVTFHPSYSYANFVGTYKPTMTKNESDWLLDEDKKKVIAVLQDKSKTAQEKYDLLYDKFKDEGLTRLPLLLGIYTDEAFKTRKMDGTGAADDNSGERNHGKAIRPYLNLSTKNSNKEISYEYVPGPFMRIYTQAINHPEENFLLLIEEINRANVAAVFGDVFQLLDRKNGISQYPIATSEDVKEYLLNNLDCLKGKNIDELSVEEKKLYLEMRIPANMFIWATMNSADQGVFPMDTAFKRRWEFEYIGVDDVAEKVEKYIIPIGDENHRKYVKWNDLRVRINDILSSDDCKVNEDKLLGPFFITKRMLESACDNEEQFIKAFESKVIMYLFEDVMKMRPANIFKGHKGKMIFSEICKTFEEKGEELFGISNLEYTEKEEQE